MRMRNKSNMAAFPDLEFPLYAGEGEAAGQPRQYLQSRINSAAVGGFSAAVVSRSGELVFRRNAKGRYVHYLTPCLPLARPNTRTPYDPIWSTLATKVASQVTYFQWNYKDVYVPPHLLYELLSEATELDNSTVDYNPLVGSAVASLRYHEHICLFYASGPLLQTLTCGLLLSHNSLYLRESEGFQLPGRVLEVKACETQGKAFVCARTTYQVAFFQGPSEEDITTIATIPTSESDVQLMTLLALFQTDYCVSSVTLSPYLAGEGVVVTETGGIYLWQQGQSLQVLQKPQVAASLSGPSHFWRCCYGSHPRSLVLAEHSGISLGDFRSSQLSLSPLLTTPTEWLPTKSLISTMSPSSHPHHFHFSTSHSLVLIDTRQPHWPLLEQSHDLGHAPQVLTTAKCLSLPSEQLVMLSDTVSGESRVFSVATPTDSPPCVHSAPHTVATYSELESVWKGRPALPLIGPRLRLPMGGASIVSLGGGTGTITEEKRETFAAVSMSIWGDLFYQLWSYHETTPTAPPTSIQDDSWLHEALQQEQELQVSREEWIDTAAPLNFKPLLEYLNDDLSTVLCVSCLVMHSSRPSLPSPLPTSTPSQASHAQLPPTQATLSASVEASPINQQCAFCGENLTPLRTVKLEQKLVSQGLLEDSCTGSTIATKLSGLDKLKAHCEFSEPGDGSSHDDHTFWDGWREDSEEQMTSSSRLEATPTKQQTSEATPTKHQTSEATPTKHRTSEATPTMSQTHEATPTRKSQRNLTASYTPTSSQKSRKRNRGIGF